MTRQTTGRDYPAEPPIYGKALIAGVIAVSALTLTGLALALANTL